MELTERKKKILRASVDGYIRTAYRARRDTGFMWTS